MYKTTSCHYQIVIKQMISKKVFKNGIMTLSNVLTKNECKNLIAKGEQIGFFEASVRTNNGQQMLKSIRNNERIMFSDTELADDLFKRINPYLDEFKVSNNSPVCLNDYFRIYKYNKGQRFNQHKDGQEKIDNMISNVSVLFYLNDDFTGGSTSFYEYTRNDGKMQHNKFESIKPVSGSALLFWHKTFHTGDEIELGEKYVLRSDLFYNV
jgi:prolyl 4-hydroxylase